MNNRHNRGAEFARFRREFGGALVTWLVDANDPSLQAAPPRVVRAAYHWCANLPIEPRHCICCLSLIWEAGRGRTLVELTTECGECEHLCRMQ